MIKDIIYVTWLAYSYRETIGNTLSGYRDLRVIGVSGYRGHELSGDSIYRASGFVISWPWLRLGTHFWRLLATCFDWNRGALTIGLGRELSGKLNYREGTGMPLKI